MVKIDPDLADALAGDPRVDLDVVVTASGTLEDLLAALCDVEVVHVYHLIRGAAVRGPAGALRGLAASSAVASMEPVRRVKHS